MSRKKLGIIKNILNKNEVSQDVVKNYVEKYKPSDEHLSLDQKVYFIFDYNKLNFSYISENATVLSGKPDDYFHETGETLLKRIFRDKDLPIIISKVAEGFKDVRSRYGSGDLHNLSYQIFVRLREDLCGGRNKLIQYRILESDNHGRPMLCYGWINDISVASTLQYISASVNFEREGKSEIVFQQKFPYKDKQLSTREIEIVKLLVDGNTSQEIAEGLDISVKTVNNHRQNILRKLKMRSTSEVVRYAVIHGHY